MKVDELGRDADTLFSSGGGTLWMPTVSPNGQMAALIQLDSRLSDGKLVVLDGHGAVVGGYGRHVQEYHWCSDKNAILFITGTPREDGEPPFIPTGTFTLDIPSGSVQPLRAPTGAYGVRCARFDSAAYVKVGLRKPGESVYRIDPASGRSEPTPYYDFNFSPSGRFYLFYNKSIDSIAYGWHVLERSSNRRVAVPGALGAIEGWALSAGDILSLVRSTDPAPPLRGGLRVRPRRERAAVVRTLYDVERGAVLSEVAGDMVTGLIEAENSRSLVFSGQLRVVRPTGQR